MKASELVARVEKVCGELRADQRANLVAAAREIGTDAVLDVLDQVRVYKSWVVLWAYLDRKVTEKGDRNEEMRE